jgi:hypothetical protein
MSSNQFAIFLGSTVDSFAPTKYFPCELIKNLLCCTNTYEEANKKFDEITLENKPIWIQIVCLNTCNIIKSYKCFDIRLPLVQKFYDDDDDYYSDNNDFHSDKNNDDKDHETNTSLKSEKMDRNIY